MISWKQKEGVIMKCKKCGMELAETETESEYEQDSNMGSDVSAKDSVLSELIEQMQGSVGDKLKPSVMAIEIKKKG
jgi:hypothetical protein